MVVPKKVLITGAHGGLGSALSDVYRKHSWSVVGIDKKTDRTLDHTSMTCDFTDTSQVQSLCQQLKNYYPIHTFICNAAYYHFSSLETITTMQLMDAWMVSVVAHFQLLQTLVKEESGIQKIVVIGSDQCFEAMDFNIAYAMSKAALIQMVKSFAAESESPHTMAVCPGTLSDTPITHQAAIGLSHINGLSIEENLKSFDKDSPTGHCIDPMDLAAWIFENEEHSKFPSGHVEFLPTL
jgi:NAD(P)-dependent dehydrogenase (short-subunit alcohol dehydrogenase family)